MRKREKRKEWGEKRKKRKLERKKNKEKRRHESVSEPERERIPTKATFLTID